MDDIRKYFPGCHLPTQDIRRRIKMILGINDYFCYKCFCYIGKVPIERCLCPFCYTSYCEKCLKFVLKNDKIDKSMCFQCIENM